MINTIYTISFILTFIYLYISVSVFNKKISPYFTLLFACVMISNFGYMQLGTARTIESAVYANQTTYLGGSFSSIFLFFCVADLCKEKLSPKTKTLLIIYGAFIFFLSGSIDVLDLYYKEVTLIEVYGVHTLKKVYGPLHILYPLQMAICWAGCLYVTIKAFFKKRIVSYKHLILLLNMMGIVILTYIAERIFKIKISLIPIAYDIGVTVIFIILTKVSMYDVGVIFSEIICDTSLGGILCVDTKGRFLGADNDVYNWFPETKKLGIDYKIDRSQSELYEIIWKWILDENQTESVILERNNCFYSLEHSLKVENRFKRIHVIYFRDVTQQQNYNKLLESEVAKKTKKLRKMQNDIIIGMASTVEGRDSNTGGHIQRTSDVINIFVQYLQKKSITPKVDKDFWHNLTMAAPLHDYGKTVVPDAILNKPGKFTDEEYEIMKTHAAKGAEILERILNNSDDIQFKNIAVNVAHFHHEKWDGNGYPEKLKGTNIPFEARIMALADVFDALVSKRVYKDSFSYDKAFDIIKESAGTHFDPELTVYFLECREKLEELYNNY